MIAILVMQIVPILVLWQLKGLDDDKWLVYIIYSKCNMLHVLIRMDYTNIYLYCLLYLAPL